MAREEKLARVLALASALSATNRGIAVKEFAEEHGYKQRSVYRDIESLESAGYPIIEEQNRYRLQPNWTPPRLAGIDQDEALALLLAKQLFASLQGTGFASALESLWTKLGSQSPGDSPVFAVRPLSAIDYRPHEATLATLRQAIAKHKVVSITYQRPNLSEPTERLVESGELYMDPALEQISLIAWCRLRGEVRSFAAHRISNAVLLDEHFQPRPEATSANKFKSAFRAWSGDVVQLVRLKFAPCVAREIEERTWHESQKLHRDPEHYLEMAMQISEPLELVRWLLGFGPDVEVLEPAWLSEILVDRHRAALDKNPL